MRTNHRIAPALIVPALAVLPLTGCFETASSSELSCTQSRYCPDGYVCMGAQPGLPGRCQKPTDAGRSDATIVADSAGSTDGRVSTEVVNWGPADVSAESTDGRANIDGLLPPSDGPSTNADTPAAIDQAPSPDISNAPDLAVASDIGSDASPEAPISPPDTTADSPMSAPDVGRDQKSQELDVAPDLPYGPELGPDVPPTGCVIGGTSYASSAANPANTCQICRPATSVSSWSNADEGTSCNGGQYCNSGVCKAGCFISGTYYANGAANPANACQTCQTTYALTSWTASANGVGCGIGQVCSGGTCQSGCWIGGTLVGSGTTDSSNVCQICKPMVSTSGWSSNADGTSCGSGPICSSSATSYGHWACQGGTCTRPAATACPSTGCDTSTGLCKDACGSGTTPGPVQCGTSCCASSQFCISNTSCGPKASPGSTCPYGNAQCTTNYCVDGYCCVSNSCGIGETCSSGTCACAMNATKVCDSCADWNFEWGTDPSPWTKEICPNWATANGTTSIAIDSSVYHAGTGGHSLVAQISVDQNTTLQGEVTLSLPCATNLAGYGISAWVYVAGPALPNWNDGLDIDTWSGSTFGTTDMAVMGGVTTGQWFQITRTLPATITTPVNRIGLRLVPSMVWSGQMYVDDVVLTAP